MTGDELQAKAQAAWEADPGSVESDLLALAVEFYGPRPLVAHTLVVAAGEVERLRGVVSALEALTLAQHQEIKRLDAESIEDAALMNRAAILVRVAALAELEAKP